MELDHDNAVIETSAQKETRRLRLLVQARRREYLMAAGMLLVHDATAAMLENMETGMELSRMALNHMAQKISESQSEQDANVH